MIYVGRSSISSGFTEGAAATVFNIGRHHAKISVDLWLAETSTYIGMPLGADAKEDFPKAKIIPAVTDCEGAIVVFPPGHGKPLDIETPVLCGDGSYRRLGDITVGDSVVTHMARPRRVEAVFEQGKLPCVRIVTRSGRQVVAAGDHPFMTTSGWKNAGDIVVGDPLARLSDVRGVYISDEVVSVEDAGERECRCLSVEEDHTFTASDLVVHNSELGAHFCARRISENPYEQGWVVHAQSDQAEKCLGHVANMFDMDTEPGRRNRALYPNIPTKFYKKNSKLFWFDLPNRTKSPTMSASGVRAKKSGADASFIWFDDPVDQRESEQDKERDRTYALVNGTWLTRLRGRSGKGNVRGTFHFTTTTLWHPDDANCRRIELARQKKLRILVSRQGTGGPRSFPKFEAVWPEMYPASKIEKIYEAMKNPTLFSAAYMSNPVAESLKIIRQLRFYDPASPDHVRFLKSCTNYLSLDPSATNRPGSDKVGIVHAGMGEFSWEEVSADGVPVYRCENRLRIVDANQIHATQSELVEYTCGYSLIKQVDHVIVETRSGFVAVAEMFENMHGIKPIRIDPGNKSKDVRLRAAAPALEDGNADDGIRAVVEFPGKRDEAGNIVPDERFDWLYRQILDFGFAAEDHCVDALTQLVNYLAPELSVGKGVVSRIMQEEVKQASNPRLKSVLSKWFSTPGDGEPAPMQDARWMLANQGAV